MKNVFQWDFKKKKIFYCFQPMQVTQCVYRYFPNPMLAINRLSLTELFNSPNCFPCFRFWCRLESSSTSSTNNYWLSFGEPLHNCVSSFVYFVKAPLNNKQGPDLFGVMGVSVQWPIFCTSCKRFYKYQNVKNDVYVHINTFIYYSSLMVVHLNRFTNICGVQFLEETQSVPL